MSSSFFRSARFLKDDGFGKSTVGLVFITALMAAWLIWAFFAQITLYQVSDQAYLESNSTIIASFDPAALVHIRPNQSAKFRLDDFPWTEYGSLCATVTRVEYRKGHVQVELIVKPDPSSRIPLKPGLSGTVEIAVEKVSPASLVLRTAIERLAQTDSGDESPEAEEVNP